MATEIADFSGQILELSYALKQASIEVEKFEDGVKMSARRTRSMLLTVEKQSKSIRRAILAERKTMGRKNPKKGGKP